jgi:hypothetical protein
MHATQLSHNNSMEEIDKLDSTQDTIASQSKHSGYERDKRRRNHAVASKTAQQHSTPNTRISWSQENNSKSLERAATETQRTRTKVTEQ